MARKKKYNEEEVVEKAMNIFWKNGYKATSMKMLEEEMGINKFSIYASFGSKNGLFIESLKQYKLRVNDTVLKFKKGNNGTEDIRQFFYDSIRSNFKKENQKGCFLTNTFNEFSENEDQLITKEMIAFMNNLKSIIEEKLRTDPNKDEEIIQKQANYLILAKHGLAAAARVNTDKEIDDYIEMIFQNI